MFQQFTLDLDNKIFDELSKSIQFENIIKGRKATNLVDIKENLVITVPIIRTTSIYRNPAQKFPNILYEIINKINKNCNTEIQFNNVLIEIYDNNYTTMGFHSDQSLDLDINSFICIFSCYSNPDTKSIRKLVIKNKVTEIITEYMLNNNSIIMFPYNINQQNLHKIILDTEHKENKDEWMGITFRLSKTFIRFIDNKPFININSLNIELKLATEIERKEFYKLRSMENKKTHFTYPPIDYTISLSDLLPPI